MPQALVLSHNGEPAWDWDPYLRWALRPLNPVVLFGVTGKSTEAPKMQRKHAPMQWWKALPVCPAPSNSLCSVWHKRNEPLFTGLLK